MRLPSLPSRAARNAAREAALDAAERASSVLAKFFCRLLGHDYISFTDRYWEPNAICRRCRRCVYSEQEIETHAKAKQGRA